MTWIAQHRKTVVAVVGAAVLIGTSVLGADNAVVQAVIAVATALGVYTAPNAA
jgi:hypothetical protein